MSKKNLPKKTNLEKSEKKISKVDKKHIHVVLSSNRIEKFDFLKKKLEQNSDIDLIRYCLDRVYETIETEPLKLREAYSKQIQIILKNNFFKNRHLVENVNDILNDAVYQWIQTRKQELSLYNFELREELQEKEKNVALIFIEHQNKYAKGMTMEDITQYSEGIEQLPLSKILNKFVENKMIIHDYIQGEDYYYIPVS